MSLQTITALSISTPLETINFDGSSYILVQVDGLEAPLMRLPRYNLPGSSGAFISNALYGERALKIAGVVNASDGKRTTYLTNRSNLISALSLQRDSSNNPIAITVSFTLANRSSYTLSAYQDTPLSMGFSPDQVEFEDFLITLVCPDPNIYSTTLSSTTISLLSGAGMAIPNTIGEK